MTNFLKVIVQVISYVKRDPTGTTTSVYVVTGLQTVTVGEPAADTPVTTAVTSAQVSILASSIITIDVPPASPPLATPNAATPSAAIPSAATPIPTVAATGTTSAFTLAPSTAPIAPASTLQTVIASSAVSGGSVVSATFAVPASSIANSGSVSSLTSASTNASMIMVPFTSTYTITYNGSYASYSPEQATSSIVSAIPSSIKSIASTNDVIATLALEQQFAYADPPWFTTLPYDITQYYHRSSSLMTLFSYVATAHNAVAPSPTNQGGGGGGLSKAASIGIGVGAGVGGLGLLIGLIVGLLYRRRQKKRRLAAVGSAGQEGADMQEKRGTEYKSELPGGPVSRAELPSKDVDGHDPYDNRANIRVYGQGRAEMSAVNY